MRVHFKGVEYPDTRRSVGGANFTSAQKNSPYSNRMSHQVKVNSRAPEQMFSSTVSNRESVMHKNGDSSTMVAKLEEVEKKLVRGSFSFGLRV